MVCIFFYFFLGGGGLAVELWCILRPLASEAVAETVT